MDGLGEKQVLERTDHHPGGDDDDDEGDVGRVVQFDRVGDGPPQDVAHDARHQDRARAELRDLFTKQREVNAQVKNLIDIMERGGLDSLRSIQDRFAARQAEADEISQLIALKKRSLETPIAEITPEKVQAFATAMRTQLQGRDNPAFRRAYLRLMLDKVVVGKDEIRISGPKAVLAHQLSAEKPLPPSLVPTFVDGWRTGKDSNPRPPDS